MIKHPAFLLALSLACAFGVNPLSAQITDRPRPEEWKQLAPGARFIDRFLPMPNGKLSRDTWGGDNVLPRYVDNGIEDNKYSYWGGNIRKDDQGKYHMYVCGWLESSPNGHMDWFYSTVFHATSDNPSGPFTVKHTIGQGHNPEMFQLKDGRYVIYVIDGRYVSNSLDGPWEYGKFEFNQRDRNIIEGLSNLTFAKREDGSYLMVCRGGGIWISETGLSSYNQLTDKRVYPPVPGNFEDPVVWRDHIQYHLIVNDWYGRIAYYLRSKDGLDWVVDPGEAYTPGIAVHADGKKEDWFKYERIKVLQDQRGRAIQANFAVIDTFKTEDKKSDNHSSKNICIPLNPGMLLTLVDKEKITDSTKTIRVKIEAEQGFNPHKDIDIASLRFGTSAEVNYGRGCKALKTEQAGADLIVTFDAKGHGITAEEFAPKILGKRTTGELLYGYTRLPWINYNESLLSARIPTLVTTEAGAQAKIEVQNFGQITAKEALLELWCTKDGQKKKLGTATIPTLKPYEKTSVSVPIAHSFEKGIAYDFTTTIAGTDNTPSTFSFKMTPVQ